jgi:hypothetical protein
MGMSALILEPPVVGGDPSKRSSVPVLLVYGPAIRECVQQLGRHDNKEVVVT